MSNQNLTAIPSGSLILITGATSYLASYVIKDLLERGFRVRGVVRSIIKAKWLVDEVFPFFVLNDTFDLLEVPDLTVPHAFDHVVGNSKPSAILHFATPYSFSPDPNDVIPKAVEIVSGLLHAAAREPSVKKFVLTSTVGAVYSPRGGIPENLTQDSWNEAALEKARAPPPYEPLRGALVYAASKVEAERAMFKFAADEKPGFAVATVNPFLVIGPVLHERYLQHSTAGWIRNVYNGKPTQFSHIPPACQVNVQDVATLHVAAVLDPGVDGERLFAWAGPINLNLVLEILRRQHPDRRFIDDGPPQPLCLATIGEDERLRELLKKWSGRDGWITLEQGVDEGVNSVA